MPFTRRPSDIGSIVGHEVNTFGDSMVFGRAPHMAVTHSQSTCYLLHTRWQSYCSRSMRSGDAGCDLVNKIRDKQSVSILFGHDHSTEGAEQPGDSLR